MRTLGKWAILTHDELEKIKDLAYQKGLRSKWKTKKNTAGPAIIDDPIANLLSAVDGGVVIPQMAA